ncbi:MULTISPECIES: magnesium transporter [Sporosarcina]|uniref:magnesium transporter n=1 Tax=Sporosarcina TaxID=1569 RepID=UPI000694D648|nr:MULTISPECIES: magnesium transporter [Sporosarcina]WJY26933.1 magnesium transporter [Sporosarcina sp. 0.2-SM1T-5]
MKLGLLNKEKKQENWDKEKLERAIVRVLSEGKKDTFLEIVHTLPPHELAEYYKELPKKRKPLFLEWLSIEEITGILRYLSKDEQLTVLERIGPDRSTHILHMMQNNDLAFLLTGLSKGKVDDLIAQMRREEMESILHIMDYPPKTAGRVMTNRYIPISPDSTVGEAEEKLKTFENLAYFVNYLYVVDENQRLIGVVTFRDLLLSENSSRISDIMRDQPITVDVQMKQEEVARIIGQFDFEAIPVVSGDQVLVGTISGDQVLDIVVREADEDIEMLLASGKSIDFRTKPVTAARRRLPWLILLLFIGLVSGSIISRFEETLEAVVALAFFMPMIAGMTGNTGTQSLAVVVRGLASEEMTWKKATKLILRELVVGVLIGVTCGLLIAVIAFFWQGSAVLGFVVGVSLLCTLIIGTIAGTVIPLILNRFKVDPAVASGPLITTLNDILSLLIYFGIATMFLSKLT